MPSHTVKHRLVAAGFCSIVALAFMTSCSASDQPEDAKAGMDEAVAQEGEAPFIRSDLLTGDMAGSLPEWRAGDGVLLLIACPKGESFHLDLTTPDDQEIFGEGGNSVSGDCEGYSQVIQSTWKVSYDPFESGPAQYQVGISSMKAYSVALYLIDS
ncbi:MAG: hypothetical protein FWG16_04480 [Micrococcales bacterium]|nr:hypothetical protein [Micrococcales bacterium]